MWQEGIQIQHSYYVVFQTNAQKELISKYGNNITPMDSIYRKYGFPGIF